MSSPVRWSAEIALDMIVPGVLPRRWAVAARVLDDAVFDVRGWMLANGYTVEREAHGVVYYVMTGGATGT